LRTGSLCNQRYRPNELLMYNFWAPDRMAPGFSYLRVERKYDDQKVPTDRFRLRYALQPQETGWIEVGRVVSYT